MAVIPKRIASLGWGIPADLLSIVSFGYFSTSEGDEPTSRYITLDGLVKETLSKDFTVDAIVKEIQTKTLTLDAIVKQISSKTFTIDSYIFSTQEKTFTLDGKISDGTTIFFDFEDNQIPENFTLGGNQNWFVTTNHPHSGTYCFRSGSGMLASQVSWFEFTMPIDGALQYYSRVSSEGNCDILHVLVNSVERTNIPVGLRSGERDYSFIQVGHLWAGDVVRFSYLKDYSVNVGDDCIYIDDMVVLAQNYMDGNIDFSAGWPTTVDLYDDINLEHLWALDETVYHSAPSSLKAYQIGDSGSSRFKWYAPFSGKLSFYWKVDSEGTYDTLRIFKNGSEITRISGQHDWALMNYTMYPALDLTKGDLIEWSYIKDSNVSVGADSGWIDDLVLTPPMKTLSITLDGVVLAQTVKTLTLDGIIAIGGDTFTKDFTLDGLVKEVKSITTTLDAIVKEIKTKTFTTDGIVLTHQVKTLTIDGYIFGTQTFEFTLDGRIKLLSSVLISLDGLILAIQEQSFTLDGIVVERHQEQITLNGIVKEVSEETISLDGIVKNVLHSTISFDGLVKALFDSTLTLDGIVAEPGVYQRTTEFTLDGIIAEQGLEKQFSLNALIKQISEKSFTFNGILVDRIEESFTVDAFILTHQQIVFTLNGVVWDGLNPLIQTVTFTLDGYVITIGESLFGKAIPNELIGQVSPKQLLGKVNVNELKGTTELKTLIGKSDIKELTGTTIWKEITGQIRRRK